MLRKLQQFTPAFLQQIDRYLLLNKPAVWATRIHHVTFWAGLALGLLLLKAAFQPMSLAEVPAFDTQLWWLLIPAGLAFFLWAYRVYQFSIERNHGERSSGHSLRNQLIYLLGAAMIFAGPVAYNLMLVERSQTLIDEETFVEDLYVLNQGAYLLRLDEYGGGAFGTWRWSKFAYSGTDVETAAEADPVAYFDRFIRVFEKYSDDPFPYTNEELVERYQLKEMNAHWAPYMQVKAEEVFPNTRNLYLAHKEKNLLSSSSSLNGFLFVFLFVIFAFSVFQQTSWKNFLLALASAVGSGVLLGVLADYLSYAVQGSRDTDWLMLLFGGAYVSLFAMLFVRRSHTRRQGQFKSVVTVLLALSLPVLLVAMAEWAKISGLFAWRDHREYTLQLLLICLTAGYLVWNLAYRHRLSQLQAHPTRN
jgi:hypothetical protein